MLIFDTPFLRSFFACNNERKRLLRINKVTQKIIKGDTNMKKALVIALCLLMAFSMVACNNATETAGSGQATQNQETNEAETRIVLDASGNEVEIAKDVKKVVNLWNSANEIIVQLGAEDIMVGGSSFLQSRPWMTHIFPGAKDVEVISDGQTANVEKILEIDPDVIISVAGRADALKEIGEPVVELTGGKSADELMEQMNIVAKALGSKYEENAEAFFTYFNKNLDLVEKVAAMVPEEEKIVVLHGTTSSTTIDKSVVGSLFETANVTNAFAGSETTEISYEQIIAANPDVIIVAQGNHAEYEKFMTDPLYADVSAVKNNRVHINPAGMFYWDAFSGEMSLEILWMAKTFYPDYFKDVDLAEETKYFYKTFLDYEMTDEEVQYLYEGKGPNGEWQDSGKKSK